MYISSLVEYVNTYFKITFVLIFIYLPKIRGESCVDEAGIKWNPCPGTKVCGWNSQLDRYKTKCVPRYRGGGDG